MEPKRYTWNDIQRCGDIDVDLIYADDPAYLSLKRDAEIYRSQASPSAKQMPTEEEMDIIDDIRRMNRNYHGGRITQAEQLRDELAAKMDDLMRSPSTKEEKK